MANGKKIPSKDFLFILKRFKKLKIQRFQNSKIQLTAAPLIGSGCTSFSPHFINKTTSIAACCNNFRNLITSLSLTDTVACRRE
ncbi:MAG: hypothetical protein LBH84_05030 [Prevotellaceae bacterium]|jgi:hypothetical protein|nr:hypothetical protein [Prevotellaceae bacterium]